jgi:hypothetical protein
VPTGHGFVSEGTSLTVRQPAFRKAEASVSRVREVTWSYFCWESIHRPLSRVECASQLTPPKVGEVRNALRAENPWEASSASPWRRTASTPGENQESCTATRP